MFKLAMLLLPVMLPADDPLPALGPDVAAIVRVDLDRLDVNGLAKSIVPGDRAAESTESIRALEAWVRALRDARARTLLITLDFGDVNNLPLGLVPVGPDADVPAIGRLLTDPESRGPIHWPGYRVIGGLLVAGSPPAIEKYAKGPNGPRADLIAALIEAGDSPTIFILNPSATQRRVLEEELPNWPRELGGAPTSPILRGARSVVLALRTQPKPVLDVQIRCDDAKSLGAVRQFGRDLLKYMAGQSGPSADAARDLANVPARVNEHSLSMEVDLERATSLVNTPFLRYREASGRSRCVNNLKQIALALHNYHSAHNSFPPAFRADKAGKPLLSWRVLILPYLEQDELYKRFHLDEPWDSPHNLPLAAKIPPFFACPESAGARSGQSALTTYLTPRGPATLFPGTQPVRIQDITDGTSNTIMVVDVPSEQAVVWTRPDDWDVGPEPRLKPQHADGTNVAIGDGSVRFFKASIKPALLRKLLTRNGGEVISWDEL